MKTTKIYLSLLACCFAALHVAHAQWLGSGDENNNIWRNGNVGIGIAPTEALEISGNVKTSGDLIMGGTLIGTAGYINLKPTAETYGVLIRKFDDNNFGNLEVTADGLGFAYNNATPQVVIDALGNLKVSGELLLSKTIQSTLGYIDLKPTQNNYNYGVFVRQSVGVGTNYGHFVVNEDGFGLSCNANLPQLYISPSGNLTLAKPLQSTLGYIELKPTQNNYGYGVVIRQSDGQGNNFGNLEVMEGKFGLGYNSSVPVAYVTPTGSFIASNQIGIGTETPNPAYKLDVNGTINATEILVGGQAISADSWLKNGSSMYYNNGNVGIGTDNPVYKLHVDGPVQVGRQGIFGTYVLGQVQGIWSTNGLANINEEQNSLGMQRGLAYTYNSNNPAEAGISGLSHQLMFAWNGQLTSSISLDNGNTYFSGKMGIGTEPDPNYQLDVNGTINATEILVGGQAINGGSLWSETGSDIYFNSGKVGVGTATPTTQLEMHNGVFKISGTSSQGEGVSRFIIDTEASTMHSPLEFRNNNGVLFKVLGNGNVGIGTNNPVEPLSIRRNDTYAGIRLLRTDANWADFRIYAGYGQLEFRNSQQLVKMVIEESGNIGIGTEAPAYKLDVAGTINASEILVNGQALGGSSIWTEAGNDTYYNNGNVGIGTNNPVRKLDVVGGGIRINYADPNENLLQVDNNVSYGLVVDKDLKVGVGISQPEGKFDVKVGEGILRVDDSFEATPHGALSFRDGLNNFYRHSMWIINTGLNGGMVGGMANAPAYNVAPDNGIYFVPGQSNNWDDWSATFAIKSDGNVGIGTTSPTTKLHVSGAALIEDTNEGKLTLNNIDDNAWHLSANLAGVHAKYFTLYSDAAGSDLNNPPLVVTHTGEVGIGTSNMPGDYKLYVAGKILSEGVKVKLINEWPDYVFGSNYKLRPLAEVESYIEQNNHLPDVPSAQEIAQEGIDLGQMDATLLQKVEELTLYIIEQQKQIKALSKEVEMLKGK